VYLSSPAGTQIGTSKLPPRMPASHDPFAASTASEVSFDEEEDAFVPLTQVRIGLWP
jgi:hypothetical protein